jgi:hypothetical protein
MLKSVVQKETIDGEPAQHPLPKPGSVHPDRDDRLRTAAGNEIRLVTGLLRSGQQSDAVRHQEHRCPSGSTIATAQHCDPLSVAQESLGELDDHRRFAGSANREISDTDNRNGQSVPPEPPGFIPEGPKTSQRTVRERGPSQPPRRPLSRSEHRSRQRPAMTGKECWARAEERVVSTEAS